MPRTIGGALDVSALAKLHFHALDPSEQAKAIQRMRTAGQGEHTIAHATGLSVEFVRQVLSERRSAS